MRKFSSAYVLQEVWHKRYVSLQLLLLNSSAKLRSIILGSLPICPETGHAALATTALTVASRHLADTASSWAADSCKGSCFSKQSHLFWKSHPFVVPEQQWSILGRQPREWRETPRSWRENCPRSACILWGTAWSCCGSRTHWRLLRNTAASEHLTPGEDTNHHFLPLFQRQKQPPHGGPCPSAPPLYES